jgi:hypothetical protein
MLAHRRLRRQVGLLAAGVLAGREQDEAREHILSCARCRAEYEPLRAIVRALEADPARTAESPVSLPALVRRVEHQLDLVPPAAPARLRWALALSLAAALFAAVAFLPGLLDRAGDRRGPASAAIPPAAAAAVLGEHELDRLERNVAREHAARYLNEASEVLVAVAATGLDCDRRLDRLDVGEAPERSRELLRKSRLVETDGEAVASAQGVLDDVQLALLEVAELPSCVRRGDVERVRERVERRQLLMRIRLMTRELEG